jgi:hypothetical protein
VREFSSKDNLARRIVHHGDPSRFAPWIDLDTQRLNLLCFNGILQNDRKRETFQDRRFPCIQQVAGFPWMNRIQWLPGRIDNKHVRHGTLLLLVS